MTYTLGAKSLSFCKRVDPRLMAVANLAISISTQDFGFTAEQSRTLEQERKLLMSGVSHSLHSHHLINDGSVAWEPVKSQFGYSGAVDAVPWDGKKFVWDWDLIYPIAAAFKQASVHLSIPVTWGGCWKLLQDIPGDGPQFMRSAHTLAKGFDGPHFSLFQN